jgi:hypothetical protein
VMVSANSLWNQGKQRFTDGWRKYDGLNVALDSGGYVAMKRYGRYRWSVEQYVGLAKAMGPEWWAQMDFCCEPDLIGGSSSVGKRIDLSARHLEECQRIAAANNIRRPMPVLQGWKPSDYCQGPIYEQNYDWPTLVGVGSVCRRHLNGPNGLFRVISALDDVLPPHVKLHLFGVKGTAAAVLATHHRIESIDSMAWSFRARKHALHDDVPCTNEVRAAVMGQWYENASASINRPQPQLTFEM